MFRALLSQQQQVLRPVAPRALAKRLSVTVYHRATYTTPAVGGGGGAATKAESQKLFDEINDFWFSGKTVTTPNSQITFISVESDKLHDEGKVSFQKWWFQPTSEIDTEIKRKFGAIHDTVIRTKQHVDHAKETADGTLALIILLDQMGRNMYRGDARAYAGDSIARSLAMYMVRRKFHEQLRLVKRSFVYMPLMHAEDAEAQELSVQLYTELAEQLKAPDEDAKNDDFAAYAQLHRDVIRDFGRFPSRNAALKRESTPEEIEWLKNSPF
ncbi:hypothetical protein GGI21_003651 [Coemansia aciculifera]|nr:hypothetical protein GGI21_003651 [Coemansia aciculifera]